jgi:phosphoribosylformylglycinamidine cyclo-ligase
MSYVSLDSNPAVRAAAESSVATHLANHVRAARRGSVCSPARSGPLRRRKRKHREDPFMTSPDPYQASGVDYDLLDVGKRDAVQAALATSHWLAARGGLALDRSRGESAFVFELAGRFFGFVMEGLGTKSVIAQQYYEATGENRFDAVAIDAVGAIVNDLCSVGALPLVANAYFATGGSNWYTDAARSAALVAGWKQACDTAGCVWGGGESPSLPGLLLEGALEIAGTSIGVVPDGGKPVLGQDLAPGDSIVFISSNGLHANGAALARAVVASLQEGIVTELPSGEILGEALLRPSVIYVPLVAKLLEADVRPTYFSHVTGHGLLKVMRAQRPLTHRISALPKVPEVLTFLTQSSGMSDRVAYRTLNMGIGYAVFCRQEDTSTVIEIATDAGYEAMVGGQVEAGPRRVVADALDVVYDESELQFTSVAPGG